ncbi:F-box/kelch-repeat protein At3g23880-like isoform X2 [Papaver somniferum]|uniref:F-box/kelch-repeat protein At3g23880-like isoform X2 n=1 Tax=Papaver somniferum TaxID=3469 RepID=UPI000E6F83C8|nr:F-box/kelch-repeat protein At3g23880-like isoform X2 [Papaver somniferum]
MSISSRLKQEDDGKSRLLNLPDESHDEIFLRLPAKSILSSRCVCKHFYNLLSKPSFIKNHVNRNKNNNPNLLFKHHSGSYGPMIYSIGIDYDALLLPSSTTSAEFDGSVMINYPFKPKSLNAPHILGSCNGLICLKIHSIVNIGNLVRSRFEETDYFSILNPLTREFKEFKKSGDAGYDISYGFGYDSKIDDFKLVMVSLYAKGCVKFDVYKVKSDSWSSFPSTVNYSFRKKNGVFFNGCLHWLGSIKTRGTSSEVIVSFDISNETVLEMPLPENIMPPVDYSGKVYKNVGLWGGCIGIAFIWNSVRIGVWVMQKYGVKESWIKKYTLTTAQLPSPSHKITFWRPLWCFDNGEILVNAEGNQLHLYDPTTERVRSVVIRDITMDNSRESYVESIVSVGSGTFMEKRVTDGDMKNSERQRLSLLFSDE